MKKKKKLDIRVPIIISLVIVILLGIFVIREIANPKTVYAIDFSKMDEKEILEWAKSKNIEDKLQFEYVYDEETNKEGFLSQSLNEGESILDKIVITLSKGKDPNKEVKLPIIDKNTNLEELEKWFKDNGFNDVTYEYKIDDNYKYNEVISLNKNNSAKRNEPIVVYLGAGDQYDKVDIEVPDFKNYSKNEINAWANNNHINVSFEYDFSDSIPANELINQNPKAKSIIHPNDEVKVTISNGKGITMINLIGYSKKDAADWAYNNGLNINFNEEYSNNTPSGNVISQNPNSGKLIGLNQTITLSISLGQKNTIDVGVNYIGMNEQDFINAISNLGLKANKVGERNSSYPKGQIIQYPDSTERDFIKGDIVDYVVSLGPQETINNNPSDNKPQEKPKEEKPKEEKPKEEKPKVETADIPAVSWFQNYAGSTAQETINNLKSGILASFINVEYRTQAHEDYDVGYIIAIVDENGNALSHGQYPINKKIIIIISEGMSA